MGIQIQEEESGQKLPEGGILKAPGPALGEVCTGEENKKLGRRRKGGPRNRDTSKQLSE